jgi:hypothetical protein
MTLAAISLETELMIQDKTMSFQRVHDEKSASEALSFGKVPLMN